MNELIKKILCVSFFLGIFLFGGCNDNPASSADNTQYPDSLYVIFANTDSTFHVGQKVVIKWKYPSTWSYSQVKLILWADDGDRKIGWIKTGGIDYPTAQYEWTILSSQSGTNCYIELSEYNDNLTAISKNFTIEP